MKALEALGRVRLSETFFMRDFLYSEIAAFLRYPQYPGRSRPRHRSRPAPLRTDALNRFGAARSHLDPLGLPLARGQRLRQRAQAQLRLERVELRRPHLGSPRRPGRASAPPPLSSSTASSLTTSEPATGRPSPGGSTITCPTTISNSSRSTLPSTSAGRIVRPAASTPTFLRGVAG